MYKGEPLKIREPVKANKKFLFDSMGDFKKVPLYLHQPNHLTALPNLLHDDWNTNKKYQIGMYSGKRLLLAWQQVPHK